jgi:hypothetical protein
MSIFRKLFGGLFGAGGAKKDDSAGSSAFWLYVQCDRCGEKIRVRVSREHDLSADFDGGGDMPSGFYTHKEIIGRNCFNRIQVDLTFNSGRVQTEQTIRGGKFITREEYEASEATPQPENQEGSEARS